jgi:hypothetical protein
MLKSELKPDSEIAIKSRVKIKAHEPKSNNEHKAIRLHNKTRKFPLFFL